MDAEQHERLLEVIDVARKMEAKADRLKAGSEFAIAFGQCHRAITFLMDWVERTSRDQD